ncbi:DUF4340 domain-containing protein [Rubritalea spongiae]|uniref:DUF4340 domain-containing protein n=1 Tax=Rubritalea spongiae TaxID=430797 RepID=A0ABW5E3P7_9BACT
MSTKVLVSLWALVAVLFVAVLKVRDAQERPIEHVSSLADGDVLLEKLDSSKVATLEFRTSEHEFELKLDDGKWLAPEKGGFPADADRLKRQMGDLFAAKVTHPVQAGEKYYDRFGVAGGDSLAEDAIVLTFKDAEGEVLETLFLGDLIEASTQGLMGGSRNVGRRVRLSSEPNTIYSLKDTFMSFSDDLQSWLKKDFIKVQGLKSVKVEAEDQSWSVVRESEEADFELQNLPEGKQAKASEMTSFKRLLSSARFNSVLGKQTWDDWEKENSDVSTRRAKLQTFEGFEYILNFAPQDSEDTNGDYVLSVSVSAELAKERKAEKDETEEETKRADKKFAEEREQFEQKLAAEKACHPYLYLVSKSTLGSLLDDLETLTEEKKEDIPNEEATDEVPEMLERVEEE